MRASWLKDAVFYEIYPQSFKDSNADGIGDFNGIIEKLDYIRALGCNALWINPCFDSPFKDAGYDVRDYKRVAPRYGCNSDLYRLFGEAHRRGIRVLLDLVPGHTSEEHLWFRQSQMDDENPYADRYIWTHHWFCGMDGLNYIGGESQRNGVYALNFFKCQPALNYGFLHPTQPWQQPMDAPGPMATRAAIKDIMRFWLDHGCDGFRVDMAGSLVKHDDADKTGTRAVWRDITAMLDADYPEAALVAEWSDPGRALRCGFDMDFVLNHPGHGYSTLMRDYDNGPDHSYFRKEGEGDIRRFLEEYMAWYEDTRALGYMSLITCNHDTTRPRFNLDASELKLAYAFLLTMPGVPFIYYGDEIGMRYLNLPNKEGGYTRTGSRTPMQWDHTANLGFSEGCADSLYLPVDPAPDAPTVAEQEEDPHSLLNTVRRLTALRHAESDLQADGEFAPVCAEPGAPFVYRRGALLVAVNPAAEHRFADVDIGARRPIFTLGSVEAARGRLALGPQSFAVLK